MVSWRLGGDFLLERRRVLVAFLIRRLLVMVPLLIGITFIVFAVMAFVPGDPFAEMRMNPSFSPDTVAALEREFGFGQPLLVRYAKWLWQAMHSSRLGNRQTRCASKRRSSPLAPTRVASDCSSFHR